MKPQQFTFIFCLNSSCVVIQHHNSVTLCIKSRPNAGYTILLNLRLMKLCSKTLQVEHKLCFM